MGKVSEMLLKKMSEEKDFAERILSQTAKEKVMEIALEEGIELESEDIDEANAVIAKALKMQNEGELSEEELENVAGGTGISLSIAVVTLLGAILSLGSAAAVTGGVISATVTITINEK